ncbi:hypothetical protein K814_0118325 [Pseudomonas fluorescens LMG 5329]|uniref:Uncharacterized protein n=1 Tax=Pseudomonas fluorescens LMG 5329 TaxID=1324332 RepID=A0A0A1YZR5_PSEFL|nr:hypothetical protein K814_0118325 [Pseudomonas fluorescens LMG 5329]
MILNTETYRVFAKVETTEPGFFRSIQAWMRMFTIQFHWPIILVNVPGVVGLRGWVGVTAQRPRGRINAAVLLPLLAKRRVVRAWPLIAILSGCATLLRAGRCVSLTALLVGRAPVVMICLHIKKLIKRSGAMDRKHR